ncbi:MAG TPA: hypothetical protein VFZ65_15575 [Planctomycetota bacterium]|nr:hypothetical protein [Planctomycetota bacterium]
MAVCSFLTVTHGCSNRGSAAPAAEAQQITIQSPAEDVLAEPGDRIPIVVLVDSLSPSSRLDVLADGYTAHQIVIARGEQPKLEPDGSGLVSIEWNTRGVPSGSYSILARACDATSTSETVVATGRVWLDYRPNVHVDFASGYTPAFISRGHPAWSVVDVYDPDDVPTLKLFFDADADLTTTADQFDAELIDPSDRFLKRLRTVGLPIGEYSLFAVADDRVNEPVVATSGTRVEIRNLAGALPIGGLEDDGVRSTCALADGCLATGSFSGTASFGVGTNGFPVTRTAAGNKDLFVARYALDGTLVWLRTVGGINEDVGSAVCVAGPYCYVTGHFSSQVTVGATALNAQGKDGIVLAYDLDGELRWVQAIGGVGHDRGLGIASLWDSLGGCVVAGSIAGSAVFGAGQANQTTVQSLGNDDGFVARYDDRGEFQWVRTVSGPGADVATAITATWPGRLYVAGTIEDSATFAGGAQPSALVGSVGGKDAFVAGYSSQGDLMWTRRAGGPFDDDAVGVVATYGIGVDIVGSFTGTAMWSGPSAFEDRTSHGGTDAFVASYTEDGELLQVLQAGGPGDDVATGVWFTSCGRVIVGSFEESAEFGDSPDPVTLVSAGASDVFLACFNGDEPVWVERAGGVGRDVTYGLSSSYKTGFLTIAGSFENTASFGVGYPRQTSLIAAGGKDGFIAFVNADGGF